MSDVQSILNLVFPFVLGVIGIGCATGVLTSWFKHRRPKQLDSSEMVQRLNEISERLAHLENATDAVAVEVERISEAQRFTSKLLAGKSATPT